MMEDNTLWMMTEDKVPWVNSYANEDIKLGVRLKKETNDCSVRSFAVVWGVSYERAHSHLQNFGGRKHRKGLSCEMMDTANEWCKKTLMKKGPYSETNRISLKSFCEKHPVGRYWVGVSGHALAVIDGVVHDYKYGPRRQVTLAWRVYGPKEEIK